MSTARSISKEVLRVNAPTEPALLEQVARRLRAGEGFALATLNLDHLVKLAGDASFRQAYDAHDMVTADGFPIVWRLRSKGIAAERVPGSELIVPLARLAVECGGAVAIVGTTEAVLSRAGARLRQMIPGLQIAHICAPSAEFDPESREGAAIIEQLQERKVSICYLALGAPKQERFAARARALAPTIGFVSVGASIDFIAGGQKRAPALVRKINLEWAWRLASNPARLGPRYLSCAALMPPLVQGAVVDILRGRR